MSNKQVSKDELERFTKDMRELFVKEASQNGGDYCETDLRRVASDDEYCHRFLLHHKDQEKALKNAKETLKWRKEFGANEIKESNISKDIEKLGGMYLAGKDKEGRENMIFVSKAYKMKEIDTMELKRYWVYWLETLEKRSNGKGFNVINYAAGAGLGNVDMEATKFMVSTFASYYPHVINRMYVFELPLILNAIWKIIKTWMDQDMVNKIKFVDKSSLAESVDASSLPDIMGGTMAV